MKPAVAHIVLLFVELTGSAVGKARKFLTQVTSTPTSRGLDLATGDVREPDPADTPASTDPLSVLVKIWLDGFASGYVSAAWKIGGDLDAADEQTSNALDQVHGDPAAMETPMAAGLATRARTSLAIGSLRTMKLFSAKDIGR